MDADDGRSVMGKRILIELSHAIEHFALAAEPGEPLVVIALFQKASYFSRESGMYGDIARRGAVTLVGLAEHLPPELPAGVRHQLIGADDPLVHEWSVTVLGPHGGATLVATDLETVAGDAPTLEQGRQFEGRWSFRRDAAYREVVRLRSQLALPPSTVREIDAVLSAVVAETEPRRQQWWDGPLRFLLERVDHAIGVQDRARVTLETAQPTSPERDPRTGLPTAAYLQRWTAGLGAGTLPIGLVALRVLDVAAVRQRYGMRAEMAALMLVAGALQDMLTDGDRAVRIGREEFLLVLPGWTVDRVVDLTRQVSARTARLDEQYPFVALGTALAATVTRDRPLPIGRLFDEVGPARSTDGAVRLLAG